MITITRQDKAVVVSVAVGTIDGLNYTIPCSFQTSSDLYAALLAEHLRKRMKAELSRIRSESYEEGWKDAKAKRVKTKYFGGWW